MIRNGWLVAIAAAAIVGILVLENYYTPTPTQQIKQDTPQSHEKIKPIQDFSKWHEFTAPEQFKVLFPSLPQHATERLEDPKSKTTKQYDMYVAQQDNGTLYMINQISMLDKQSRKIDENTLTTVINDVVTANPDSKIKTMQMGKFHDYPAIDFALENNKVMIEGKAFLVGDILYLLSVVSKPEDYRHDEFAFFMNSFSLIPIGEAKKS